MMNLQPNHHYRPRQNVNSRYKDQSNIPPSQTFSRPLSNNGESLEHYDHQSNINFHYHPNQQSNRIPAPSSSNLHPVMSPALSPRRTRDDFDKNDGYTTVSKSNKPKQVNTSSRNDDDFTASNQQQYNHHDYYSSRSHQTYSNQPPPHHYPTRYQHNQRSQQLSPNNDNLQATPPQEQQPQFTVSTSAARYAQTRFPFSPFIIRFSSGSVKEKHVGEELVHHFKSNHQIDLQLSNIRQSTKKCTQQEYDFLIYVKNPDSFCALFSQHKWPQLIGGQGYTFLSSPSFPAQLSLVVKNVDLRMNLDDFTEELKNNYHDIHNVIRLRNKFQNEIKMIKIEILSTTVREELLHERRIKVCGMVFDIIEYLSPADVLICSKCCGIGHFRRQCQEPNEICRTCGVNCPDLQKHVCSKIAKCIHCGEAHTSNSLRCAVVKDYRAALTKKLLSTNRPTNNNINHIYDPAHHPPLPPPHCSSFSSSNFAPNQKVDELLSGVNEMKEMLSRLCSKQNEFDDFMIIKNTHDELIVNKIEQLVASDQITKESSNSNNDIIKKLILPTLDLISKFLYHTNIKTTGNFDPDFKSQIEIKRTIIDQITSGKKFTL